MRPRKFNEFLLRGAQAESIIEYCLKNNIHPKQFYEGKLLKPNSLEFGKNIHRAILASNFLLEKKLDIKEELAEYICEYNLHFNTRDDFDFKGLEKKKILARKVASNNIIPYCIIWSLHVRNHTQFLKKHINKLTLLSNNVDFYPATIAAIISNFCFRSNENLILLKKNSLFKYKFYKRIHDENLQELSSSDYILGNAEKIIMNSLSLKEMLTKSYECKKFQQDIAFLVWTCASCRFKDEKIPVSFMYFVNSDLMNTDMLLKKGTILMKSIKR